MSWRQHLRKSSEAGLWLAGSGQWRMIVKCDGSRPSTGTAGQESKQAIARSCHIGRARRAAETCVRRTMTGSAGSRRNSLDSDNSCAICCETLDSAVVDKVCIVPSICVLLSCEETRLAFGKSHPSSAARHHELLGLDTCSACTQKGNLGKIELLQ